MPTTYDALTSRMNFLAARQSVIAGNIANADTPNYLARDVVVDKNAASSGGSFAMAMTNARHMQMAGGSNTLGGGRMTQDSTFIEHNGNSVRLDDQMLKMTQTQTDYRLMTELYSKQMNLQKIAIGRAN